MTNQEIFDLIACFDQSTVQTLKLSTQAFSIELSRGLGQTVTATETPVSPASSSPQFHASSPPQVEGPVVSAPLVGTYYAASSPDQAPFVTPGDQVRKGQTLCLIEAMKMMSEVPAPCDCVIEQVLKTSGELVAFGVPLFRYRPC